MAVYNPPTEDLPIFDNNVFTSGNEVLTVDVANNNYLKFPIAQGAETLTDITVLGNATFQSSMTMVSGAISTAPIVVADVFPTPTQTAIISSSQLSFIDSTTTNISSLDDTQLLMSSTATPASVDIKNFGITLSDLGGSNILDADGWSGNIASVNTTTNLTHYLGFFDSSSTGSGKPQKNASLSCNPSTGTITATTFDGSSSTIAITDTNDAAIFYPTFVSASGSGQTLRADITASPLQYEPSPGRMTVITLRSDYLAPTSSVSAVALYTGLSTGSISIMPTQSSGSLNIGNTAVTSGLCNMRPPLVLSRQLQTTNSATYPPTVATHLGFTTQTLGSSFTTTALLASTNTNLMSYAFTSANYGTYLFTTHVTMVPSAFTTNQAIIGVSNTSLNTNTPFNDLQSPNVSSGSAHLNVTCVIPIYSAQTIYLVGFMNGFTASVNNALTHFTYTRIA